ncbi:phosphonate ABC transporter, permease protein PhnE [Pseudactinotalea sp.]|uniref:phosphonate ABC transporter, permease protein PhnE n=1 Tax=Pseudactinotalea sp. TaxID=1926260 RepID=UPI003B3B0C9A
MSAEHTGRPAPPSKVRTTIGMIVVALVVIFAVSQIDARWERLPELVTVLPQYAGLMVEGILRNPFTEPASADWTSAVRYTLESVQMAWIGTLIGAVISFPIAFLAARNTAPIGVVLVVRQILNAIRAVPELILAIAIMMPIFGFGPLAGALALGVGAVGTLGKLSSEAIEGIDPGPVEAAKAVGATKLQTLRWGVVPQVLPEMVAFWLYRFEINIRASAILGVLGAGGVGAILKQLFDKREWERIGITLLVIILVTILIDQVSAAVRHRIISGPAARGVKRSERTVETEGLMG